MFQVEAECEIYKEKLKFAESQYQDLIIKYENEFTELATAISEYKTVADTFEKSNSILESKISF